MLSIPSTTLKQFDRSLKNNAIPVRSRGLYKKWLQYYLDYCIKYNFNSKNTENLPKFIQKLHFYFGVGPQQHIGIYRLMSQK